MKHNPWIVAAALTATLATAPAMAAADTDADARLQKATDAFMHYALNSLRAEHRAMLKHELRRDQALMAARLTDEILAQRPSGGPSGASVKAGP